MSSSDNSNKYDTLLDEEVWAFIDRTNACYPEETVSFSIEKQRKIYDAMCAEFFAGYPSGITSKDRYIKTNYGQIAIRQYVQNDLNPLTDPHAQVIYCHGGGYVVGGLESHDDICAEICQQSGYTVFSIDYRLSPEHLHPAAFLDTLNGFKHVAGLTDLPIVVVGDSAGGNLVSALCHKTRPHLRKPAGQVLIYPELGGDMSTGSYVEHCNAPLLNIKDVEYYCGIRNEGKNLLSDPTYSPLGDSDFSALPPTVVIGAECDPLSDDGKHYCDHINQAGGKAKFIREPGLVHGYLRARHSVKKAKDSFARITAAISMLGEGGWDFE
ncbi:MAG: alpha/beta hydrolase [Hyphomicrobiales bacterium]|nr:alpha/beta hydrolase [Hyphomicrobiales bacterium]